MTVNSETEFPTDFKRHQSVKNYTVLTVDKTFAILVIYVKYYHKYIEKSNQ